MGRLASMRHGTKKQVFAAPEMAKKHTKSELRDMIEKPTGDNIINIKKG